MLNLCGTFTQEAGDNMSKDDEARLNWAAASIMGGAIDTVSLIIFRRNAFDCGSWSLDFRTC